MLPYLLVIPFLASASLLVMPRSRLGARVPWVMSLLASGGCVALLSYFTFLAPAESPREFFVPWLPQIGLNLSLWLDGPALFFSWLVSGMGFLIFLYAGFYLDPKDSPWRFFGTMTLFMGSMLGVVISKNALLMFLFWELTSVTSFILIGHWHEKDSAREGAVRALIVTAGGGLCLMAGLAGWFWLMKDAGINPAHAMEWDSLWAHRNLLINHSAAIPLFLLVVIGAFTKSAQFPFHFWLPGAMEAPTPVSAFLHAATMVKAGIYLLGRLYPIYGGYELWLIVVGGIGVVTMMVGGFMAILSRDLKQLLAHSTVSQLGLLTAYYGFGYKLIDGQKLLPLDLVLVASHALFKGGLFLIVGVIDHGTHTRDWTRLGGLRRKMPVTAILTAIGCASMAGLPFTFGFVAKELFLKASLELDTDLTWIRYSLPALAIIASFFTVAYCLRMAVSPFFGKPRDPSIHPHEGGLGLLISPGIMIGLCLLGGIYVPLLEKPLGGMINAAYYGTHSGFHIAFFHHLDELFLIALALFALGTVIFLQAKRFDRLYIRIGSPAPFLGTYNLIFNHFVPSFAAWLARTMQSPSLSRNATVTLGVSFGLTICAMLHEQFMPKIEFAPSDTLVIAGFLIAMTLACLYVVLTSRVMLARVIGMAPIGLFVTLFFLLFKAPDLALTQILVEVVVLIALLLVLFYLPQHFRKAKHHEPASFVKIGVAVIGGAVMGLLVLTAFNSPMRDVSTFPNDPGYPTVKEYYLENTKHSFFDEHAEADYPGAELKRSGGGNNSVNVILVDFRGTDTMGEITVLGIAAIGVMALLVMGRGPKPHDDPERAAARRKVERINFGDLPTKPSERIVKEPTWPTPSLILREISRLVPAMIILLAVVLFMAGHNAPGGGFIAGLLVSVGLAVALIGFKTRDVVVLHRFPYLLLIPTGLSFALGTGLASVMLGRPFLTSGYTYIDLPLFGQFEIASAMGFDFGVFLAVIGVTMLIIEKLGRE